MTYLLTPTWRLYRPVTGRAAHHNAAGAQRGHSFGPRYELVEVRGNMITFGGGSAVWTLLTSTDLTPFDHDNAYIGVGNGTGAPTPDQQDLQGPSTVRLGMDDGYPLHLPGNTAAATNVVFQASFGTGVAEFEWNEFGIFNDVSGGRMLNRRLKSLGVKPVGLTDPWVLQLIFGIQPESGAT